MKQYFVALIPPYDLEREIHGIKQEIAEKYHSKKALKLPTHITLEPPFKLQEENEEKILQPLQKFAANQKPVEVELQDFGAFVPRTIFLNLKNSKPVEELHQSLQKQLKESNFKRDKKEEKQFHPHMTVAFRDLDKENFKKAWSDFQNRNYEASFKAKSVFLLKHNGKTWDVYKEFSFSEND